MGHSTGAVFSLRMAQEVASPYRAVIAVCPFMAPLGLPQYDALNESFVSLPWDSGRVRRGAQQFLLLIGGNDPYVPRASADAVRKMTLGEIIEISDGGHLNLDSGFKCFPLLLTRLLKIAENGKEDMLMRNCGVGGQV